MQDASGLISIGYLSRPHGIRGELVLHTESPDLARGTLFLCPRGGGRACSCTVAAMRRHHGALLVLFEGVTNRDEAALLRAHTVFVRKDALPPPTEDEVFLGDLPGLTVIVAAGSEGGTEQEIGVIRSADAPAGQILWTIVTPQGKEILFPAVEEFVLSIDLDMGEARIVPPPGLLELYLED